MNKNKFRCPACDFPIFNRRVAKCERCGGQLPAELLFTPEQMAKLDAQYEQSRKAREEQARKAGSYDLGGGDFGGFDSGGDGGGCD